MQNQNDVSFNQQYTLRWNDFQKKLINSFQSLHESDDFVDVTIACEGKSFSAHKVVLSACSPYFRRLLKANPCSHPIIILQTISYKQFEYLIDFMYNGVVHIEPDGLYDFLQAANDLKIQGLSDVQYPKNFGSQNKAGSVASGSSSRVNETVGDENEKNENAQQFTSTDIRKTLETDLSSIDNMIDMTYQSSSSSEQINQPKIEPIEELIIDEDSYEADTSNLKSKPPDFQMTSSVNNSSFQNLNQISDINQSSSKQNNSDNIFASVNNLSFRPSYDINELINRTRTIDPNNPESNLCVICNRNYSNPSNLRAHILNVHNDSSKNQWYECSVCKKKLKTKHYLINHELHKHGIRQRSKIKEAS